MRRCWCFRHTAPSRSAACCSRRRPWACPSPRWTTGGTRDIVIHEQTGLLSRQRRGLTRDVARLYSRPRACLPPRRRRPAARRAHVRCAGRPRAGRAVLHATSSPAPRVAWLIHRPCGVVVLGRSFYGLHGVGGLERHLYDLVRHHLAEGWHVTVVTRTPREPAGVDPARWRVLSRIIRRVTSVSWTTARSRSRAAAGTTILDRSTAYPWFGRRAGRLAAEIGRCRQGRRDLRRRRQRVGLRQSAARRRGHAAGVQSSGPRRVRRHGRLVRRPRAQERRLRAAARGRSRLRRGKPMRSSPPIRRSCPRSCGICRVGLPTACTSFPTASTSAIWTGWSIRPPGVPHVATRVSPTTRRCSSASAGSKRTRDLAISPRRSPTAR